MILLALIGFFTTRYVLACLGVSDYGLYSVVGGIVAMLNFVSIGMVTTTRRYVNVEMGKADGNVNKVFNVCLVLHIGFAAFIYLIAITVGLWYINNILNVAPEKISDARFVYFISTTISAMGIVNIPYQALMAAFERFRQISIIDFVIACLKIPLIIALCYYEGNHLRFFAIGFCIMTLCSLIAYFVYCYQRFGDIVRWNFYRETSLYKEILIFNNYTALGAFAYIGRSQGSSMVVNYFFGTFVNGVYAIACQVEGQIQALVGNLGIAADPQITQSYSAGDYTRSYDLVSKVTRFSVLSMILLAFSLFVELETLLGLWLGKVPDGAVLLCQVMLISLLFRSLGAGVDGLIQATGKVKNYQIIQSTLLILGIPLAIVFFTLGYPPVYIIFSFIICDILRTIAMFKIICSISTFNFKKYALAVYFPVGKVVSALTIYYFLYQMIPVNTFPLHLLGFSLTFLITVYFCFRLGMNKNEQEKMMRKVLGMLK